MTKGFRPDSSGVAIDLDADESAVLRSMAALLLDMVEAPEPQDELAELVGIGGSAEKPDDPVLARLFPDAYREDTEAAGDFRRYTEDDLRLHKRENARTMLAELPVAGGTLHLDLGDAHAWMKAINDVRLALGTRLGVDEQTYAEEERGELDEGDAAALHIYDWLGGLQESLVQSLFGASGLDDDEEED
ncbi:DUF2017 domain-containing protein [Nocardiopsis gilva YIM 90087]|uniref:DUF2017 domain-containing protein n=1 Tax=Nocardiopsis gilva YIM 90087 TaxID=1235441 RepID=A0A223SAR4_9ACTN|nr:DUF2017 domain-containing protein [Nocardiopsis gilva]ASU85261.1 DUF2017 domain-containing protein [Nocardiopsis gilva YIM 90087]